MIHAKIVYFGGATFHMCFFVCSPDRYTKNMADHFIYLLIISLVNGKSCLRSKISFIAFALSGPLNVHPRSYI